MTMVFDTPESINMFRLITTMSAMKLHIRTDGQIKASRMATPTRLKQIATEYTGRTYPRGMQGMRDALSDLEVIRDNA